MIRVPFLLLPGNAGLCRQITQMSLVRDLDWDSSTCPLGFETLGILPEGNDGTEIVACSSSSSGQLLASGDEAGRVKLFSFPVPHPKVSVTLPTIYIFFFLDIDTRSLYSKILSSQSQYHAYSGHSSPVTNVSFLHDDTRVISSGGKDSSIIQWAVV